MLQKEDLLYLGAMEKTVDEQSSCTSLGCSVDYIFLCITSFISCRTFCHSISMKQSNNFRNTSLPSSLDCTSLAVIWMNLRKPLLHFHMVHHVGCLMSEYA